MRYAGVAALWMSLPALLAPAAGSAQSELTDISTLRASGYAPVNSAFTSGCGSPRDPGLTWSVTWRCDVRFYQVVRPRCMGFTAITALRSGFSKLQLQVADLRVIVSVERRFAQHLAHNLCWSGDKRAFNVAATCTGRTRARVAPIPRAARAPVARRRYGRAR